MELCRPIVPPRSSLISPSEELLYGNTSQTVLTGCCARSRTSHAVFHWHAGISDERYPIGFTRCSHAFRIPPALCTFAVSLLLRTAAGKAALSKAYATTMDQFTSLPIDNVAKYAHKKALDAIMSNPSGEISMRNALKGAFVAGFPILQRDTPGLRVCGLRER